MMTTAHSEEEFKAEMRRRIDARIEREMYALLNPPREREYRGLGGIRYYPS